jgi:cytochrome c2
MRCRADLIRPFGLILGLAILITATYGMWSASQSRNDKIAKALTAGDPSRAPVLIRRYGCGGCHTIPSVAGANGKVAPALDGLRERVFIGGVVRNSPEALIQWIVSPQAFSPQSAMPTTGITKADATDIAAFLYAH